MSISALRNQNSLDKLLQQVQKDESPATDKKSYVDERLWKANVDKAGNGYAVIRFLPAPKGEELPWVRVWNHAFQGPTGQWYIENSLTTLNQKDPVSEYNSQLWNSGVESDKEIARKQKRKLQYYSNIYVVQDSANPENEGKVFLYRYGKKIFDKLMEAMQPAFEDETPMNPFDLWEGANFKLKIRKVDGYWNYDKSEFDSVTPLKSTDEELESIWNSEHSLADFTASSNFKSYDELKTRLDAVLSGTVATKTAAAMIEEDETPFVPDFKSEPAPQPASDDDDDAMSYFEKLANE
ncbi:MAG: single-stranded DNA-binding protein [Verrucomicrobia bacterium TMED175]|nr:MAG: single-stranded DNA-binding protein [Verrucomicrobia bacterium TMED175]|tara:strand:- start:3 stop:887 length:885 start_codon:yes stop_codon:yes gene_type:complete